MGSCFVGDNGGSVTPDRLLSRGRGRVMGRGKGRDFTIVSCRCEILIRPLLLLFFYNRPLFLSLSLSSDLSA